MIRIRELAAPEWELDDWDDVGQTARDGRGEAGCGELIQWGTQWPFDMSEGSDGLEGTEGTDVSVLSFCSPCGSLYGNVAAVPAEAGVRMTDGDKQRRVASRQSRVMCDV